MHKYNIRFNKKLIRERHHSLVWTALPVMNVTQHSIQEVNIPRHRLADNYHGKIRTEGTSRQGLVAEFIDMVMNLQGLQNRKFLHLLNDYQVFERSSSITDLAKMFLFYNFRSYYFPCQSSTELKNKYSYTSTLPLCPLWHVRGSPLILFSVQIHIHCITVHLTCNKL
jgi:hypothetical protein